MNLSHILKQSEHFVTSNSPAILTGVGVVGTVTTAFLTGKASFAAAKLLDDAQTVANVRRTAGEPRIEFTLKEKVNQVWKLYIPPVGVGVLTITSIIMANRIGTRRTAAIAAAYSLSEKAFSEYKEKVVERMGAQKEQKVRDEIAQDRVDKADPENRQVIIGSGDVLCLDMYTDRYFESSMEEIKAAQNRVNHTINNNGYASLTDFYDAIGLPRTQFSDEVGWSPEDQLELNFSTALTPNGKPCLAISFRVQPDKGYLRFH